MGTTASVLIVAGARYSSARSATRASTCCAMAPSASSPRIIRTSRSRSMPDCSRRSRRAITRTATSSPAAWVPARRSSPTALPGSSASATSSSSRATVSRAWSTTAGCSSCSCRGRRQAELSTRSSLRRTTAADSTTSPRSSCRSTAIDSPAPTRPPPRRRRYPRRTGRASPVRLPDRGRGRRTWDARRALPRQHPLRAGAGRARAGVRRQAGDAAFYRASRGSWRKATGCEAAGRGQQRPVPARRRYPDADRASNLSTSE